MRPALLHWLRIYGLLTFFSPSRLLLPSRRKTGLLSYPFSPRSVPAPSFLGCCILSLVHVDATRISSDLPHLTTPRSSANSSPSLTPLPKREPTLLLLGCHADVSRALLWIVNHLGYAVAHRSAWSRDIALNWNPYHQPEPPQLMPAVAATPRRRLLDTWR